MSCKCKNKFFLLILASLLFMLFYTAAVSATIDVQTLGKEILKHTSSIEELQQVRALAGSLGLKKVYLFGGAAAAVANHKRDNLFGNRKSGNNYDNVFRANQDVDIVVDDATEEQISQLKNLLKQNFPGYKLPNGESIWDVRSLRETFGNKSPLLGNKDYLDQHNDSQSMGLVRLMDPAEVDALNEKAISSECIVDLKTIGTNPDGDIKKNNFLQDVYAKKITYYFSNQHEQTSRYKSGENPALLSVIRYLNKAFQYHLNIPEDSLKTIDKVISARSTGDTDVLGHDYVSGWIRKNATKLLENSQDVERSIDTLDSIAMSAEEQRQLQKELQSADKIHRTPKGLRKKLLDLASKIEATQLAWYLGKEPLRSFELGQGSGELASDYWNRKNLPVEKKHGYLLLGHDTKDVDAFNSITYNIDNRPNIFISRDNAEANERARYGDGLYTLPGENGAFNNGLSLRLVLDPRARSGSDFREVESGLLILNKNAVTLIADDERDENGEHREVAEWIDSLLKLEISPSFLQMIGKDSDRWSIPESRVIPLQHSLVKYLSGQFDAYYKSLSPLEREESLRKLEKILSLYMKHVEGRLPEAREDWQLFTAVALAEITASKFLKDKQVLKKFFEIPSINLYKTPFGQELLSMGSKGLASKDQVPKLPDMNKRYIGELEQFAKELAALDWRDNPTLPYYVDLLIDVEERVLYNIIESRSFQEHPKYLVWLKHYLRNYPTRMTSIFLTLDLQKLAEVSFPISKKGVEGVFDFLNPNHDFEFDGEILSLASSKSHPQVGESLVSSSWVSKFYEKHKTGLVSGYAYAARYPGYLCSYYGLEDGLAGKRIATGKIFLKAFNDKNFYSAHKQYLFDLLKEWAKQSRNNSLWTQYWNSGLTKIIRSEINDLLDLDFIKNDPDFYNLATAGDRYADPYEAVDFDYVMKNIALDDDGEVKCPPKKKGIIGGALGYVWDVANSLTVGGVH